MIIVLKADTEADSPEVLRLIAQAESYPNVHTELHRIQGATRSVTEIYLLGLTGVIPTEPFEEYACVEKVVRVTEKYRAIGRHGGGVDAVGFEYNGVRISQETLHVFPGLCAVDTRQNLDQMFAALATHGIQTSRAGAYKPRTSPYDFQGLGRECLPWVFERAGHHEGGAPAGIKKRFGVASARFLGSDDVISVESVGGRRPREVSRKILCEIIEPRVEEILSLARQSLANEGLEQSIPSGLVLTGGCSALDGILDLAEEIFEAPVRLGLPSHIGGLQDVVRGPMYTTGVGLTCYGANQDRPATRFRIRDGSIFGRVKQRMRDWFYQFE